MEYHGKMINGVVVLDNGETLPEGTVVKVQMVNDVPAQRISEIVAGKRAITADTDLRLCRFFGLSSGYWLRAQAAHDTEVAQKGLAKALAKIKPWNRLRLNAGRPA